MSISTIPEWKQLLLERRRREEEVRERKEREEEEKLASMPAWKREILLRRKAKQDVLMETEKRAGELEPEAETTTRASIQLNPFLRSQNSYRMNVERDSTIKAETIIIIKKNDRSQEVQRDREEKSEDLQELLIIRPSIAEETNGKKKDTAYGRVSQLISKFGQTHKPPCRSKSSESLTGVDARKVENKKDHWRKGGGEMSRGVPKRSFSFSERALGSCDGSKSERKAVERTSSDRRWREDDKEQDLNLQRAMSNELSTMKKDGQKGGQHEDKGKHEDGRWNGGEQEKGICKDGSWDEPKGLNEGMQDEQQDSTCLKLQRGMSSIWGVNELSTMKKDRQTKGGQDEDNRNQEDGRWIGSWDEPMQGDGRRVGERFDKGKQDKEQDSTCLRLKQGIPGFWGVNEVGTTKKEGQTKGGWDEGGQSEDHGKHEDGTWIGSWDEPRQGGGKRVEQRFDKEKQDEEKDRTCLRPQRVMVNELSTLKKDGQMKGGWSKDDGNQEDGRWFGSWDEPRGRLDEGQPVARRESWKAGRPLTRVESLRERIRQKEQERQEGLKKGTAESRREVGLPQTLCLFDVKRELSEDELPVSVPAEQELCICKRRHDGVKAKIEDEDLPEVQYKPPSLSSSSSSSDSPTFSPSPESEITMSRIYNLKPVSARTGVCLSERNSEVQTIKIRPGGQFVSSLPKIPGRVPSDDVRNSEISTLQRQAEQLSLKEQEAVKQNDDGKQKATSEDQTGPNILRTSLSQQQTKTVSRSSDSDVTSSSSPSSFSPSTPQFTIRSASARQGKKGTTITITPRQASPQVTPPPSKTTSKTPNSTPNQRKKRFPTAEEIEVIGGYQNLERSCLVKNRDSPKMVRVCFDDSQLENVCTYPSEDSVIVEEQSSDDWRRSEQGRDDKDDEEEEDDGVIGGDRGMSRLLRVDESCRR